jgi:hypothetical protein
MGYKEFDLRIGINLQNTPMLSCKIALFIANNDHAYKNSHARRSPVTVQHRLQSLNADGVVQQAAATRNDRLTNV